MLEGTYMKNNSCDEKIETASKNTLTIKDSHVTNTYDCICEEELKRISDEYEKEILSMRLDKYSTLDFDVDLSRDFNKNVLVLDVGGTFFKISYINISCKDGKLIGNEKSTKKITFPKDPEYKNKYWFDWVAEKLFQTLNEDLFETDSCGLIFSYPLKYNENGDVFCERFTKNFCFEREKSITYEIKSALEGAFFRFANKEKTNPNNLNFFNESNLLIDKDPISINTVQILSRIKVISVLNDSTASFLHSKFYPEKNFVSIIQGTGTNSTFKIKYQGRSMIVNTEWGMWRPKSYSSFKAEENIFELSRSNSFMDFIIGFGKREEIAREMLKTGEFIDDLGLNYDEKIDKILNIFNVRSKQLMAVLLLPIIKNYDQCRILLNGSGFSSEENFKLFKNMLIKYKQEILKKNIDIKIEYNESSAFFGSSYHTIFLLNNIL